MQDVHTLRMYETSTPNCSCWGGKRTHSHQPSVFPFHCLEPSCFFSCCNTSHAIHRFDTSWFAGKGQMPSSLQGHQPTSWVQHVATWISAFRSSNAQVSVQFKNEDHVDFQSSVHCHDLSQLLGLQSEEFKSAHCLRHHIRLRSSFKVRTARPAAERLVRSLNLEREIGLYPSFTCLPVSGPSCLTNEQDRYIGGTHSQINSYIFKEFKMSSVLCEERDGNRSSASTCPMTPRTAQTASLQRQPTSSLIVQD